MELSRERRLERRHRASGVRQLLRFVGWGGWHSYRIPKR
jgi:hypothetical protein